MRRNQRATNSARRSAAGAPHELHERLRDLAVPPSGERRPAGPDAQPADFGRVGWLAVLAPVLVGAAAFVAFLPALSAEFVSFDDDRLFEKNTSFRGFSREHLRWMFTTTFMGHYQPLTWLSHAVDHALSGMNPPGYHLNNVLLHALNAVMVYFVALRLIAAGRAARSPATREPAPPVHGRNDASLRLAAVLAALLFAVHPLRTESVAWVSERRDVLSLFFLLGALLCYLRACPPGRANVASPGAYAACCVLLAASLLSKAWGWAFFLVVLILDAHPLRRLSRNTGRVILQKAPIALMGLGALVMAGRAQRSALDTMPSLAEWGIGARCVQACYGLMFYIWKTVWPTRLAALYERPASLDPWEPQFLVSYLFVAAAALALYRMWRRWPPVLSAAACYLVLIAPVLGFGQSGPQLVADRYSYVSCIGWAVLAGGAALALYRARPQGAPALIAAGVAITTALAILTWRQAGVWHNSETLWAHALRVAPPSTVALQNYGILLRQSGRVDEAIEHYRRALDLKPDSGETWFALANALKQQRRFAEAETAYHEATKTMTQKYLAYLNLGNMYRSDLRRPSNAAASYRAAIAHVQSNPRKFWTPTPYLALGITLAECGDLEGAREALMVAARYPETRRQARANLDRLGKPAAPPRAAGQ